MGNSLLKKRKVHETKTEQIGSLCDFCFIRGELHELQECIAHHMLCTACFLQVGKLPCVICAHNNPVPDPVTEKVESETKPFVFKEEDNDVFCSICLDELVDPLHIQCNHEFCRQCVIDWVNTAKSKKADPTCPLCRAVIDESIFKIVSVSVNEEIKMPQLTGRCNGVVRKGPRKGMQCSKKPGKGKLFCHLHAR